MDRDRDRRPRDIPPEDRYGNGGGQSYRPGNARERSPPRMGNYRPRSPPRRPDYMDSYRAGRGRSRTPPRRDDYRRQSPSPRGFRDREQRGGDGYRSRPRSPPMARREDLLRDDLFRRDKREYRDPREYRDDRDRGYGPAPPTRSPPRFRDRSPIPLKRGREPSPVSSRGRRSPPPAKRERLASPPRRYDDFPPSRGASPPRRRYSPGAQNRRPSPPRRPDRVDPRTIDDWRRPRSPAYEHRAAHLAREEGGQVSGATSRHSTPPVHPSRLMSLHQSAADDRPGSSRASPRDPPDSRDPYRASDSSSSRHNSAYGAEPTYPDERDQSNGRDRALPPNDPLREDDGQLSVRAPPTGPAGARGPASAMAPPTGPAAGLSAPAGPRATGPPPSGPRGAPTPRGDFASRGEFTPRGRGGYGGEFAPRGRGSLTATFRGGRGGAPGSGLGRGETPGRGGGSAGAEGFGRGSDGQESNFATRPPPSGPRGSFSQQQPPTAPAFRPSNTASATTFPRPQRFPTNESLSEVPTGPKAGRRPPTEPSATSFATPRIHPALQDLPKIVDGGQKAESVVDRTKMLRLEEEAEKLRRQIEDKETRKRRSLREWDRMTRETELAALRSELAEEALRQQNGEDLQQAAF